MDEIDRVSGQTQFNGVNVLAKDGKMSIQVGANDGQTIDIDLKQIDSSTLGLKGFSVANNSLELGDTITQIGDGSGAMSKVDLQDVADALKVDVSSLTLHNVQKAGVAQDTYVVSSGSDNYSVSVGTDGSVALNTTQVTYNDEENGVTGAQSDQYIKVAANDDGDAVGFVTVQGKNYLAGDDGTGTDAIANSGDTASPTAVATGGTTAIELSGDDATAQFTGASTADPLALLDKAIASVDTFRSSLGAVQNRLDSAITNLNNTTTNLSEAQSRIQDADYATEVSNMSKAQNILQAGNSVLAKSNQVPQHVRSLLQG